MDRVDELMVLVIMLIGSVIGFVLCLIEVI